MQGGWGAMGGAWGQPSAPARDPEDVEVNMKEQTGPASSTAGWGAAASVPTAPTQKWEEPEPAPAPSQFGAAGGAYSTAIAGGSKATFGGGGGGLGTSQADLDRRAKELDEREKRIKKREEELEAAGVGIVKPNWPICRPFLRHSIAEDIAEKGRRPVREAYLAWYGLILCLLWNFFTASVILGYDETNKVGSWFLAVVYTITGIPISFWMWYWPLYKGAKTESTTGFIWFFIGFGIHIAFCTWAAIAIPFSQSKWSFNGFVTAMNAFDVSAFAGIVFIIGSCLWTCLAACSCWVIMDVFLFFRGKGGIQQAKSEAALAAFKASASSAARS